MDKNTKIDTLVNSAFELIENGQYDEAIEAAKQLKELRHSSNFEITALAYQRKGENSKAILALEEGVEKAPQVWLLWQLLGNLYSDENFFDKSHNCYSIALNCPNVDKSSIHLNYSIAYLREGHAEMALGEIELITDKAYLIKAASQKIKILAELKRSQEAIEFGYSIMKSNHWSEDLFEAEDLSSVCSSISKIYFNLKNHEKALKFAWKTITIYKGNSEAAWIIREMEGNFSDNSKHFHVLISGIWHCPVDEENECPGFFTNYDIVAEDQNEALSLLKRFEPEQVRDSITIEEIDILKDMPESPKGVYCTSAYCLYPLN